MSTYKKLVDLVSRRRTPRPSKAFWEKFDRELGQRLDAVDAQRYQRRFSFIKKVKDAFELIFQPRLRSAVVIASLLIVIIGAALFFTNYQDIQLRSILALSDEELVDELIIIDGLATKVNGVTGKREGTDGILDELELLYELDPSFFLIDNLS